MEDKIKILFHNRDAAGVNYFRTQTPAMQLERDHSDKFRIEINSGLDFNDPKTVDYLKSFHIIHYHRQLIAGSPNMIKLANELKQAGVILVMDIDDFWYLDKSHPYYSVSKEKRLWEEIMDNLKIADYITTTSEYFASIIRKVTGKDNVTVLENSVDPTWMKQFKNKWKADPDGLVRITYMAGSSHRGDVAQMEGAIGRLHNDKDTKGKFKIQLAGWDTEGKTTDIKFNDELRKVLHRIGLWNQTMVKEINASRGDVDSIPNIPNEIKEAFRGKVFNTTERPIDSTESMYLTYEKILTNEHKIIEDDDYLKWLGNFERGKYSNEGVFARRWTRKANIYAEVLNETDIALAPLADHEFNHMKSNLKQVECWSRKLPVVCSDVKPYNVDGKHMENCILIPNKKRNSKYWFKYLKNLILDADLRKQIGEGLYDDFSEKYDLKIVTEKRVVFYDNIVMETLKVV